MNSKAALLSLLSLPLSGSAVVAFQLPSAPASSVARRTSAPISSSKLCLVPENVEESGDDSNTNLLARRSFVARSLALAGASALSPFAANAAAPSLEPYDDPDFHFRVSIPSTWDTTEQKLSGRRKGIFFTDPNSKDADTGTLETLGFIAYTPLRDDFTSLASFGSVDEVAQATILPKSELAGNPEASKMLAATAKNNAYYFDYVATPVVPTEAGSGSAMTKTLKQQHFRTIFTMLPLKGAAGLTLVTITLQTAEERYADVKGVFDSVIDSYGKI